MQVRSIAKLSKGMPALLTSTSSLPPRALTASSIVLFH